MARNLPKGYDRHHTLFEKNLYNTELEARQWREHPAMILPIDTASHRQLHHEVEPLPLPSKKLARVALAYIEELSVSNRYSAWSSVHNFLWDRAERLPETSKLGREALLFATNFDEQRVFIDPSVWSRKKVY